MVNIKRAINKNKYTEEMFSSNYDYHKMNAYNVRKSMKIKVGHLYLYYRDSQRRNLNNHSIHDPS